MKRFLFLVLLAALSVISGLLMSRSSWIGRVGITFFHKAYNLTKVWWQGATAVFIILLLFFFLHSLLQQKLPLIAARIFHFMFLLAAVVALYITYDDFHTTRSHRLLGHNFHNGCYLVWVGWIMECVFFLFSRKKRNEPAINSGKKEITSQ